MVDGLLLVDKPEGLTSHDVVAKVRKILSTKSVGHTGTLDPMASGLMVMLVGEATKLSDYLLKGDKGYKLSAQLGVTTDTLDVTGEKLSEKNVDVSRAVIEKSVWSLEGEHQLPIPMFSAKKINGKKLYELARAGEVVDLPKKRMKFYDFHSVQIEPASVSLELKCSKGSFIRSWASQLGVDLGVGAALSSLRRVYSAPFTLDCAITLDELRAKFPNLESDQTIDGLRSTLGSAFIPMAEALSGFPGVTVSGADQKLMRNGQVSFDLTRRLIRYQKQANASGEMSRIKVHSATDGRLMAILEVWPCKSLKIKRIFNQKGT